MGKQKRLGVGVAALSGEAVPALFAENGVSALPLLPSGDLPGLLIDINPVTKVKLLGSTGFEEILLDPPFPGAAPVAAFLSDALRFLFVEKDGSIGLRSYGRDGKAGIDCPVVAGNSAVVLTNVLSRSPRLLVETIDLDPATGKRRATQCRFFDLSESGSPVESGSFSFADGVPHQGILALEADGNLVLKEGGELLRRGPDGEILAQSYLALSSNAEVTPLGDAGWLIFDPSSTSGVSVGFAGGQSPGPVRILALDGNFAPLFELNLKEGMPLAAFASGGRLHVLELSCETATVAVKQYAFW